MNYKLLLNKIGENTSILNFEKRGCPKSLKITFASLHFAKVSDFGKVDYSDYQQLL